MSAQPGRHHRVDPDVVTETPGARSGRRRPVLAVVFLAVVAGTVALAAWAQAANRPSSAQRTATVAANSDVRVTAVGDAVSGYLAILDRVEGYQTLKNGLPFGGKTFLDARYTQVLDSVDALRTKVRQIAANADTKISTLERALDDPDGNGDPRNDGTIGGVVVDLDVDFSGSVDAATFQTAVKVSVTSAGTPDLTWRAGGVTVTGTPTEADLAFTARATATISPRAAKTFAIKVAGTPSGTFSLGVTGDFTPQTGTPLAFDAGLLGVSATGKVRADIGVKVALVDPGTGAAQDGVIDSTELADLSRVFTTTCLSTGASADLSVKTDVVGLTDEVGTMKLEDATLCDGLSAPTVKLAKLGDLQNVSVGDVVNGIAQVARAVQSAQAAGDIDLPFVSEGLSQVVQVNERLVKFFVDNGLTDPAHPLDSITFDKDHPPFSSLQELAPKLATALGLPVGDLKMAYVDGAIRFVVHQSADPAAKPDAGTLDFGDTFGGLGIAAVSGTARASIDPAYSLDFGFGFSTEAGKTLDERFFLTNNPDATDPAEQTLFTLDADVKAALDLQGAIPPVGVSLRTGGTVDLLDPVTAGTPMLSLALVDPTPADRRVTLADLATSLSGKGFPITAAVNARVPSTTVNAALDVLGTDIASGHLTVAWPDVRTGAPVVSADAAFQTGALQFAFDTTDPKKLVVQVLTAARNAITGLRAGIATGKLSTTTPLPLVGKSVAELEPVLVDLQSSLDGLIESADAFTLPAMEARINRAIADALQIAKDVAPPDLLDLRYEPMSTKADGTTTNAAIVATLTLSACTDGRGENCTRTVGPLALPFALQLGSGSRTGGIAGVGSRGTLSVGYDAKATLTFGVTLPEVSYADGRLSVSGAVTPFVQDDTSFVIGVGAKVSGTLSAALGPFQVSLGRGAANGQPARNAVAQVAARFALQTAHDVAKPKRYDPSTMGAFFSSLIPKSPVTVHEAPTGSPANCPGLAGPYDACANLPVFLGTTSLGSITFTAPDLLNPSGWTFDSAQVEAALSSKTVQFSLLVDGIRAMSDQLEKSLRSLPAGTKIPLIGADPLAGADAVAAFNAAVLDPVQRLTGQLSGLNKVSLVTDRFSETLNGVTGRNGTVVVTANCRAESGATVAQCSGSETLDRLQNLEVSLPLHLGVRGQTVFDLGFPGLSLKSEDELVADAGVDVELTFGIDRDLGFYVPTKASDGEFSIGATVSLPDTMQAELGFVPITVRDETTGPNVLVSVVLDLATTRADGRLTLQELKSATLTPKVTAQADAALRLQTELGAGAQSGLPSMAALFTLDAGVTWTPGSNPVPRATLGFEDVQVDLGALMSRYIKPAVAEIRKYTSPLEPAIDAIQAAIPGVEQAWQLAGFKEKAPSWLDLFEAVDGIVTPPGGTSGLQMVTRLIDFVQTVQDLDRMTSETGRVDLGDFTVSAAKVQTPTPVADAASLISGSSSPASLLSAFGDTATTLQTASSSGGLKFPVLEKPSLLFGMLLGQDVDLVTFDAGKLQIQRGLTFGFPIGPLNLYIGGSASLSGHFAAGFDTYGIRKAFEYASDDITSNDNVFRLAEGVLLGLYLDDFDAEDNDVPEITFRAELTAGASIGVPLFSVGAEGGIGGQIDFNLHTEPDQAGKIRYSDIAAQLKKNGNPLCFFDASAKVDAFIRAYLDTPLGKSVYPIASGVVWEQENLFDFCQTPVDEHVNQFGEVVDGQFRLKTDQNAQDFVIRQNTEDEVLVESGGVQESYTGVTEIFADLGAGADQLDLVKASGYTGAGLPVQVCGGAGVDRIASDLGPATLHGDGGTGCAKVANTAAGPDTLTGGDAADTFDGGPGDDVLVGLDGGDRLDGGAGNDVLRGGAGDDTIVGGTDNDTLDYSDHRDAVTVKLPGTSGSKDERDTVTGTENVVGGSGNDTVQITTAGSYRIDGGAGDDTVKPGPATTIVFGGPGNDTLIGGTASTQFLGDDGNDELVDGPGFETFLGGPGTDTADYSKATAPQSVTVDGRADDGPSRNGLPTGSDNLVDVDIVLGGSGPDHLVGGSEGETLRGNGGADVLEGGPGNDVLDGGAGGDRLVGDDGADTLKGGSEDDTLDGREGPDVFDGGPGSDAADYSYRTDELVITKNGVADDGGWRISERDDVTDTVERIVGGSAADDITGNGSNEVLEGRLGDDDIDGMGGADRIDGGAGDDSLADWSFNERFSDLDANAVDTILGGPGIDEIYAASGDDRIDGGGERDTVHGGTGNDTISAGDGGDSVYAGDGNDIVNGGTGDDSIQGGDGDDTIVAGPGRCSLFGGLGNDTITSGTGDCSTFLGDTSSGSEKDLGPNTFTGGTGYDAVTGGDGPDRIDVGDGGSNVDGGDGDDVVTAGRWAPGHRGNTLNGDEGDDTITGGPENDTIKGNIGDDHLFGGGGSDSLYGYGFGSGVTGGTEDDDLHGGPGDDFLHGETGTDLLDGGTGADYFSGGDGDDMVTYADRTEPIVVVDDRNGRDGGKSDLAEDGAHRDDLRDDVEGVTGGKGADRITFGAAANRTTTLVLNGGPGADTLTVKPDSTLPSVLDGGNGSDVITGGAGPDRMVGRDGDDRFVFLATVDGADVVSGGKGTDTVDYAARAKGSVRVTADGRADDGASGEKDDVGVDVEKAVLGRATAAAASTAPTTPVPAGTATQPGPAGVPTSPAPSGPPTGSVPSDVPTSPGPSATPTVPEPTDAGATPEG
ncbi:hypothetical protein ACXR2U_18635 [Jatrophihabitans sp. YIM 134969]